MKEYETLHLVKGEDLNHHGTLFAARGAAWVIEAGFTTVACEHGNAKEVVLRNINKLSYNRPVPKGAVVKFACRVVHAGTTSVMVCVIARDAMTKEVAIEGYLTFVTVEEDSGRKKPHKILLDEAVEAEERRQRELALVLCSAV